MDFIAYFLKIYCIWYFTQLYWRRTRE